MTIDDANRILAEAMGDEPSRICERNGCTHRDNDCWTVVYPDYRVPANFVRALEWAGTRYTVTFWKTPEGMSKRSLWICSVGGRKSCEAETLAEAFILALAEAVERSKG
jgi:hypothetical protein